MNKVCTNVADVWKIIFSLTFNSMESYHPDDLLVYYKFLKILNLWRTYSTSGKGLLQDPLFYCKKNIDRLLSWKTSVAQNWVAFLVCWCYWWLTTHFSLRRPVSIDYTDTLFEWSQMKIIKLEFPIFWYETFFMFKTSLLLLIFCQSVYINQSLNIEYRQGFPISEIHKTDTILTFISFTMKCPIVYTHANILFECE